MSTLTLTLTLALTMITLTVACTPSLDVPAGARIACVDGSDCPADTVCVQGAGVCEPKGSACVVAGADGDFVAAPEGVACKRGPFSGVCESGVCHVATCGDGVLDDGEQCDEGEDNADAADACRTTCRAPTCGDHIVDDGEQCDGTDPPSATCTLGCFQACLPARVDVDRATDNGCEADGERLGRTLVTNGITVDEDGNVWWDDVGAIYVMAAGTIEPELFLDRSGVLASPVRVAHGLVSFTDGTDTIAVSLATGTVTTIFDGSGLGAPDCFDDIIPFTFAECVQPTGIDAIPVDDDELVVLASEKLFWHRIGLAKSTRALFSIGGDAELVRMAVVAQVVYVAANDGRIFEVPIDGRAPPRTIVEGEPTIRAIVADDAAVLWSNTVDGTIGVFDRASGVVAHFEGGDAPGVALAIDDDLVVIAADAGSGDPGRIFTMKRDGSERRIHTSPHEQVLGVALDGAFIYWVDAGTVTDEDGLLLNGAYRIARAAP